MIYLDNAATTYPSKKAQRAVKKGLKKYGNPSSLHKLGREANDMLVQSRIKIANVMGCLSEEIYFTSGGTESDNWAIESACKYGLNQGKKTIITSCIEHHAILNVLKEKEKQGFNVIYLPVNKNGLVELSSFKAALTKDVFFVTIMMANNEIGTCQPIPEIVKICRRKKIIFHTDAVQAVGHLPINLTDLPVDMLSASSHKFHGPKGAGFLFCRKGTPLYPYIIGGGQERGQRSGTENLPAIMGMAAALQEFVKHSSRFYRVQAELRDYMIDTLSLIPGSLICGDLIQRLPNNILICFKGIDGPSLQILLDQYGVCVSVGSACNSKIVEESHVLKALNVPEDYIRGALRITLSRYTTMRQVKKAVKKIKKYVRFSRIIQNSLDKLHLS